MKYFLIDEETGLLFKGVKEDGVTCVLTDSFYDAYIFTSELEAENVKDTLLSSCGVLFDVEVLSN